MKMELEKLKGQIQLQIASLKIQSESNNVQTREAGRIEAAKVQASSGIQEVAPLKFDPSAHAPILEDRRIMSPKDQAIESERTLAQQRAINNIMQEEAAMQQAGPPQQMEQPAGPPQGEPGMEQYQFAP